MKIEFAAFGSDHCGESGRCRHLRGDLNAKNNDDTAFALATGILERMEKKTWHLVSSCLGSNTYCRILWFSLLLS